MKSKLDAIKSSKKDEDIESESDKGKEDFLVGMVEDEEMVQETAEERRLKMTK